MPASIPLLIQDLRIRLDEREAEYFTEGDIRRALTYGQRKAFYFIWDATEEIFQVTLDVPIVAGTRVYDLSAIVATDPLDTIPSSNIAMVSSFYEPIHPFRDYRPKIQLATSGESHLTLGKNYYMPDETTFIFTSDPQENTTMTLYVKKDRPDIIASTGNIDMPRQSHETIINYAEAMLRQKDESQFTYPFITEDLRELREKMASIAGRPQNFASSVEAVSSGDW